MSEIRVGENETLENALRRFKRKCARAGVLAEIRKREEAAEGISNHDNNLYFST